MCRLSSHVSLCPPLHGVSRALIIIIITRASFYRRGHTASPRQSGGPPLPHGETSHPEPSRLGQRGMPGRPPLAWGPAPAAAPFKESWALQQSSSLNFSLEDCHRGFRERPAEVMWDSCQLACWVGPAPPAGAQVWGHWTGVPAPSLPSLGRPRGSPLLPRVPPAPQ